ncbi:hypothetical protein GCM10010991_25180 [Gemmobacter aquaticus]|uniref:Uncharacterized protein n=1 Tax=Gemmobacter aquaticus TaxID=490185 RepID=A0A917YL51_9RHOB|nr:hypothetical protein [Gemmobacter aquaticus]GGO34425.1 hypothetical protein GCM10010991_25180 [Gemmobacter aquaticus]
MNIDQNGLDTQLATSCNTLDTLTPAAEAFESLIARLDTLCDAEAALEGAPVGDLAFDRWFQDAEAARTTAISAAAALCDADPLSQMDARMQALGKAFSSMMITADPETYRRLHVFFIAEAAHPRAALQSSAKSMQQFCRLISRLLALLDYLPEDIGLDEANAFDCAFAA